jgi:hypothetical protein
MTVLGRRTGDIIFRGDVADVSVMASGTGTLYVSGVTSSVTVNLSGIGNTAIDAASGAPSFPALKETGVCLMLSSFKAVLYLYFHCPRPICGQAHSLSTSVQF